MSHRRRKTDLCDPITQRAVAFYALLGVLCGDIWYRGLNEWRLAALVLFAGIGTLSGLGGVIRELRTQWEPTTEEVPPSAEPRPPIEPPIAPVNLSITPVNPPASTH